MSNRQIKTTIIDIEPKLDKNHHPYYKISLHGLSPHYFYAFSNNLPPRTWQTLTDKPHQLVNQLVLITYQETRSRNASVVGDQLPNKENSGTFYKVQQIQVL